MSEKPLHNVVICCTSVTQEERSSIMRQALEMGAVVQADLTSDVTHLVVARVQTDKYKFAARHRTDLKLMTVEWIPAIHTVWITGKDVNLPESEVKFRLPTFHSLRICVTNLDVDVRLQIERLVLQNGGQYTGDLTKENTHLVAGSATGKKWEAVNAWQCDISIVGVEWVYESLKRGASLDEKYFRLELSAEIRGQSSWFPPRIVPRLNADLIVGDTTGEKRKRPLGQSGSRKRLSKRTSTLINDGMWSEILNASGQDPSTTFNIAAQGNNNNLSTIDLDLPTRYHSNSQHMTTENSTTDLLPEELTRGIFDKLIFYVHGFPDREEQIVRHTISTNGGQLTQHETPNAYFIVPQNGDPPMPKENCIMVTEFWLERCLSQNRFEEPHAHFTSTPFTANLPIARMDQVSICSSGFSAVESMHIEKLVAKVGAIYHDTLTKGRSILLAASRECRKFNLAKDSGTRVVKAEWLWECIRRGRMVGVTDYALDGILGSQCRIDASVALKQRRSALLRGVVCYLSRSSNEEFGKLFNLAESMGAQVVQDLQDTNVTHYMGEYRYKDLGNPEAYQVSNAWLTDTFALISRQSELAYPTICKENDENVPPYLDKTITEERQGTEWGTNQKLAMEMHEIRKRINSGPTRRSSRKILGRATTLPCEDNVTMMMTTNLDETLDAFAGHRAASQGITYSDPETLEKQRVLMMKLGAMQKELESDTILNNKPIHSKLGTMRAVGLDDTRKLRR